MQGISIIICTQAKSPLLPDCIAAVKAQMDNIRDELIIIENSETQQLDHRTLISTNTVYQHTTTVGLSHARNLGATLSKNRWLFYLDDDAVLIDDALANARSTIANHPFHLFTGIWKALHLQSPPKWLPDTTGTYHLRGPSTIRHIGQDYVSGGVMIIKKDSLLQIGGFPTHLGMLGPQVGYGEESWVEEEFKKRGWPVGINPNIVIDHLVGEHKYAIHWHLKSAKAKGVANQYITNQGNILSIAIDLASNILTGWLKPAAKLLVHRRYYWQNFVIDYIGGIQYQIGRLASIYN